MLLAIVEFMHTFIERVGLAFLIIFTILCIGAGRCRGQIVYASEPTLAPPAPVEPVKPVVSVMKSPECKCDDCQCNPCKCKAEPPKKYLPVESTVMVRTTIVSDDKDLDGKRFAFTGTAVCDHTVLTCAHGFKSIRDTVTINNEPSLVLKIDFDKDVAIVQTSATLKPARIAKSLPNRGDITVAYGYEWDKQGVLWRFRAPVTGVNSKYIDFDHILTGDKAKPGRSGGGLFNADGELIGVCRGAEIETHESLYSGLDSVRGVIGLSKAEKPAKRFGKPVEPAYLYPECPDGKCPLLKKQAPPTKVRSEVESRPFPLSPSGGLCPNGQCQRPSK